jgi:hypothetical protein
MWRLPINLLLGALAAGGIILFFLLRLVLGERPRGVDAGTLQSGLRPPGVGRRQCRPSYPAGILRSVPCRDGSR